MFNISERDFLIEFAVRKFNRQYNRKFTRQDFDVKSIPPRPNTDRGYEFTTNRFDDFLRLRIYFRFANLDNVHDFKLEVDYPTYNKALGDETFVALGTIDRYHLTSGKYKFRWIGTQVSRLPVFVTDDGVAFVNHDGFYFHYIKGELSDLEKEHGSGQDRS